MKHTFAMFYTLIKQYNFVLLVFRNGKIDDVVLGFDNLEGELTDHLKNNIWLKKLLKMPERSWSVILTIGVTVKSSSMIQIFVNQREKVLIFSLELQIKLPCTRVISGAWLSWCQLSPIVCVKGHFNDEMPSHQREELGEEQAEIEREQIYACS